MNDVRLLTIEEELRLPQILLTREKFRNMMKAYISNYQSMFTNNMLISGKAGSGKTTLVVENLESMKREGVIADYLRASGHVTPSSLYDLLSRTSQRENGLPKVLVLDDVDCLGDEGCLELLKSAFDTKADIATNREVYYLTRNGHGFKYDGYGIIITNENFDKNIDVHQNAILDRTQQMDIDLEFSDMMIYTTSMIQNYLNKNEDNLTEDEIESVIGLFENEVRKWIRLGSFKRSNTPYSIRLIKKFVECQRCFKNEWKAYSKIYNKLESVSKVIESENAMNERLEEERQQTTEEILNNVQVSSMGNQIVQKIGNLKIINPKTGLPYSKGNLTYLKDHGRLVLKADKHWYFDDELVG